MIQPTPDPFDHWTFDDFLPAELAQQATVHFFGGDGPWIRREHLYCRAKRTRTEGLSPQTEAALVAMESPGMVAYLEAVTGITGLLVDRARFGGGQHVTSYGGRLGIHADFTHHPSTGWRRALNLLVYLNEGPGGGLELWDAAMRECRATITPRFNRAVLFPTTTTSYHGHPWPLQHAQRLSLAAYYYVPPTPGEPRLRTTDYRPRPWEYRLRLRRWARQRLRGT